jgi:hypothetical protein
MSYRRQPTTHKIHCLAGLHLFLDFNSKCAFANYAHFANFAAKLPILKWQSRPSQLVTPFFDHINSLLSISHKLADKPIFEINKTAQKVISKCIGRV